MDEKSAKSLKLFINPSPWRSEINTARGYESLMTPEGEIALTLAGKPSPHLFPSKPKIPRFLGSPRPSLKDRLSAGSRGKILMPYKSFDPNFSKAAGISLS